MSNVDIKRAVEHIKSSNTTAYTPIIEVIVNAIQAIEDKKNFNDGEIKVILKRSLQQELGNYLSPIESIVVQDNGIGFTDENRRSFDTLFSGYKINQGGKGFGRFTCLKYFQHLKIDSVYFDCNENKYKRRRFSMGNDYDIIINEEISDSEEDNSGTSTLLDSIKKPFNDKQLSTISRNLVEKLLPYFITKDYACPKIILIEEDKSGSEILNDYISDSSARIQEIKISENMFSLFPKENLFSHENNESTYIFEVRVFRIYSPKNKVSKISLVADKREVTETAISNYISEFAEEFYDKKDDGNDNQERNYILKTYVFSKYLDENVSIERGEFNFKKEHDDSFGISQIDIEKQAAELTKKAVISDISVRQEKNKNALLLI